MTLRLAYAFVFTLAAATPALAQAPVDGDLIGPPPIQYTVVAGDTLATIARRNHIGYVELLSANPSQMSSTVHPGETLTIPTQHLVPHLPGGDHPGIVVNLAALRLYHFGPGGQVDTYPISVGKEGWDTPTGDTKIIEKRKDPTWTVPASIRAEDPKLPSVVPPGPDNPLGQYALTLGWPGYLIHGTNHPYSIGRPSSHGCMRLYPEDIEALFGMVEVGDVVTVIDTPMTLGESGGNLYLQVTPTRDQAKDIAGFKQPAPLPENDPTVTALKARLSALEARGVHVDNNAVIAAIFHHDGMPVIIARGVPADLAAQTPAHPAVTPAVTREPVKESWGAGIVRAMVSFFNTVGSLIRHVQTIRI
jgi:L,D-transpeptidase ErfK/SrfK